MTASWDSAEPTGTSFVAGDGAVVLDSVIVTAQKRPEPEQAVPISITALSARALDIYRVENLGDLSRLVPRLLISTFSENSPTIAIRGASNTFEQIGVSKPVAIVVDDSTSGRLWGRPADRRPRGRYQQSELSGESAAGSRRGRVGIVQPRRWEMMEIPGRPSWASTSTSAA
jgi:hypothetical protein